MFLHFLFHFLYFFIKNLIIIFRNKYNNLKNFFYIFYYKFICKFDRFFKWVIPFDIDLAPSYPIPFFLFFIKNWSLFLKIVSITIFLKSFLKITINSNANSIDYSNKSFLLKLIELLLFLFHWICFFILNMYIIFCICKYSNL